MMQHLAFAMLERARDKNTRRDARRATRRVWRRSEISRRPLATNEFECVWPQTWRKNRVHRGRATRRGRVSVRAVCRARERGDGGAMLSSEAPGRSRGPRFGALSPSTPLPLFPRYSSARAPSKCRGGEIEHAILISYAKRIRFQNLSFEHQKLAELAGGAGTNARKQPENTTFHIAALRARRTVKTAMIRFKIYSARIQRCARLKNPITFSTKCFDLKVQGRFLTPRPTIGCAPPPAP